MRDLQFAFDRLIAVDISREHDNVRLPGLLPKFIFEEPGGVFLNHYFRFKIQSGRKSQILMCWTGVTIDASMFASAVRIKPEGEPEVRALVFCEDRVRRVAEILRGNLTLICTAGPVIVKHFARKRFKPDSRIFSCPSAFHPLPFTLVLTRHFQPTLPRLRIFLFSRSELSS